AGPHGLLVVTPRLVPAEPGAPGIVRLTLPVGSRAGRAGLAELAAEVVAELRVPTRAGGSLRGALQRIGAHLDVVVTASCTAFEENRRATCRARGSLKLASEAAK